MKWSISIAVVLLIISNFLIFVQKAEHTAYTIPDGTRCWLQKFNTADESYYREAITGEVQLQSKTGKSNVYYHYFGRHSDYKLF